MLLATRARSPGGLPTNRYSSRTQPRILLVMVDQLTAALTRAFGHPAVRTPHLDRLVAEGVRLDAAYSPCPVRAPARGALMSGRYVSNCKADNKVAAWPEDVVTVPYYLTLAGYDTILSGKMHSVGADQLHGFHRRFVRISTWQTSSGHLPGRIPLPSPAARSRYSGQRVGRHANA
jgi:arylsulfatase A-like enzyme